MGQIAGRVRTFVNAPCELRAAIYSALPQDSFLSTFNFPQYPALTLTPQSNISHTRSGAFSTFLLPKNRRAALGRAFSFAECLNFSPLRGENKAGRHRLPAQPRAARPLPRSRTEAVVTDDLDDRSGVDETVAGLIGIVVVNRAARGVPARKCVTRG